MEGMKHTQGTYTFICHGYYHLGGSLWAGNIKIADNVARENAPLLTTAPDMLSALIKAYRELIGVSRLQDWHSEAFREVVEEIERTIEAATNMKIEEVLEATARQEAER